VLGREVHRQSTRPHVAGSSYTPASPSAPAMIQTLLDRKCPMATIACAYGPRDSLLPRARAKALQRSRDRGRSGGRSGMRRPDPGEGAVSARSGSGLAIGARAEAHGSSTFTGTKAFTSSSLQSSRRTRKPTLCIHSEWRDAGEPKICVKLACNKGTPMHLIGN
jgi:hypothetical protein